MGSITTFSHLADLQQVDSTIDKLINDRRGLPELAEHRKAREVTEDARAAHTRLVDQLHTIDRSVARLDDELALSDTKLSSQETRLFAGGMSAREADFMRSEVSGLRVRISEMEDEALDLLGRRERLAEEEKAAEAKKLAAEETERSLANRITELWATIDESLARYRELKSDLVPKIEVQLIKLYEDLRERRGGVVVGALDGRTCSACHLEMSVAEGARAMKAPIPQCINCAAIICP